MDDGSCVERKLNPRRSRRASFLALRSLRCPDRGRVLREARSPALAALALRGPRTQQRPPATVALLDRERLPPLPRLSLFRRAGCPCCCPPAALFGILHFFFSPKLEGGQLSSAHK